VQLPLALTFYTASFERFEHAYKLTAPLAAEIILGRGALEWLFQIFRTRGALLVARGDHRQYLVLFLMIIALIGAIGIYSIFVTASMSHTFMGVYGQTGCQFASTPECAPAYAEIYFEPSAGPGDGPKNGVDNMAGLFVILGPIAVFHLLFLALRAGLNTCHDWKFMSTSAVVVFFVVFLPALFIAKFAGDATLGFYLALNAVPITLTFVYGARMYGHVRAMLSEQPGPWTPYMAKTNELKEMTRKREAVESTPLVDPIVKQDFTKGL